MTVTIMSKLVLLILLVLLLLFTVKMTLMMIMITPGADGAAIADPCWDHGLVRFAVCLYA